MADIKLKYPVADSVAITISLASLASDTNLLAGQESTAINNTTNLDLDHLVSGQIMVGTTPTANTNIEIWAYAAIRVVSGTPVYPDVIDGTDSAETLSNLGMKVSALRLLTTIYVSAATSNLAYAVPPTSIANIFGQMPKYWGLFVTHNTGVALNATGGNHILHYERIQSQTV
jgi:hypothetical protein